MRPPRRTWKVALGLLGLAAVAAAWLFLAPAQVGGSTIYSITEGNSMQPLLHKNDLALLRSQSSYNVGDVVLYNSPVLHRPVLHRILVIQGGHYFFKGDNNDFVDPGYATRAELVGKLWVRAPGVGLVVGWLGKPLHAALFAAAIVMLVLLGGAAPATRRRRRRRRGEPKVAKTQTIERGHIAFTDGTKASIAAFGILLVAAAIVLVLAFTTPLHRSAPLADAYRHRGTFSYTAQATGGALEYPGGVARTGQPLFTSLIKSVTLRFRYRFESLLPHAVHGTIELKASLLAQSTNWQQLYVLHKKTSFTGDNAVTGGPVVINGLAALLKELSTASGGGGDTFQVDLQPIVHIEGVVGGHEIHETFSPILPFAVTAAVIKLDVAPATTPPGATYVPPTADDSLASALDPVQQESVLHRVTNFVSIARYRVTVTAARVAGFTLALLALLAAVISVNGLRRRHPGWPLEERIAARFGCLVVPVDSPGMRDGSEPVAIHDFESLARLALYLERPILHHVAEGGSYSVDDDSRHYLYQPAEQTVPIAAVRALPQQAAKQPRRTGRKRTRLVLLAGIGVLLVAVTLATSFTASTSVPTTNAGASNVARQISQLAPDGCSTLSLTTIVLASGTLTTAVSNALVLGTAGLDTITATSDHGDCFIGGGGKDVINANASDFCQIGPTTGAKYKGCSTF